MQQNQQQIRATLLSLLTSFETVDEQEQWKKEKFSLFNSDCGWSNAEIDLIFFWKVYDQQRLAGKSFKVFNRLRQEYGSMAAGIRAMAYLPDNLVQTGLKQSYESGELKRISPSVASAVQLGRGGWRELGFAIGGAKKLHQWFPGSNQQNYILQWLSKTLDLGVYTPDEFIIALNNSLQLTSGNYLQLNSENYKNILKKSSQIVQRLSGGKISPNGLPGVGKQTIQFFFRDWMDVNFWRFMFKNDEHNRFFWGMFLQEAGLAVSKDITQQISDFLEPQDFEANVLARLNRMAYRQRSKLGSGLSDENIRQWFRHHLSHYAVSRMD